MSIAHLVSGWRRAAKPPVAPERSGMALDSQSLPAGRVRSVARSHVGKVRQVNEDRVLDFQARCLWAVADGMGGHCAGDVAAEAVIGALKALAETSASIDPQAINAVLSRASRQLYADAAAGSRVSGSTVVALHVQGDRGALFWAGDSRAYRMRDHIVERLTRDHSVVQDLIDAGAIAPEMAETHPRAHVITRALGASDMVEIDMRSIEVRFNDVYLLCSDGLLRGSGDPDAAILSLGTIDERADALLAKALADGGKDNISFVLIEIGTPKEGGER